MSKIKIQPPKKTPFALIITISLVAVIAVVSVMVFVLPQTVHAQTSYDEELSLSAEQLPTPTYEPTTAPTPNVQPEPSPTPEKIESNPTLENLSLTTVIISEEPQQQPIPQELETIPQEEPTPEPQEPTSPPEEPTPTTEPTPTPSTTPQPTPSPTPIPTVEPVEEVAEKVEGKTVSALDNPIVNELIEKNPNS